MNPKRNEETQAEKFERLARELGADENVDVDEVVRHLAKQKPAPRRDLKRKKRASSSDENTE